MAGKGYQYYYDNFVTLTAGLSSSNTTLAEKTFMHKTPPVEMEAAFRNLVANRLEQEKQAASLAKLTDLSKYNIRENDRGDIELIPKDRPSIGAVINGS